jgi:iron-sulfur cluster assembly accessory protein
MEQREIMDATTVQTHATPAHLGMDSNPIALTPKAVEMIRSAMEQEGLVDHGIRVGVVGGGCSGFQYSMDFDKGANDGDLTFEQEGIKFFVDPMSSMYLHGVTIDYVQGLQGAGFKFDNPNAKQTCGCGSSFST